MKRVLIILMALAVTSAYAQRKPKVNRAESHWKEGELMEAKEIVDEAIVHEKTKDDSKTWFIHGLVYISLDTAGMPGGDLAKARESMLKSIELKRGSEDITTGPGGAFITPTLALDNIWRYYINMGAEIFESDQEKALVSFEKSAIVQPDSISSNYYAGLAAASLNKTDKALEHFLTYINKGGSDMDAYDRAFYILAAEKEDHEKILELANKGLEKFPNEEKLSNWKFRALYNLDRIDDAIEQVKESIKLDPDDPELHFNLGVIYENTEDMEKAKESYLKALKLDPKYFNANFNLGVLYRNEIVTMGKEKNELGYSDKDLAKAEEIDKRIAEVAKKSLPYWLNCYEQKDQNPDYVQTILETLEYIYTVLGEKEKAAEMDKELQDLGLR